MEFEELFNLVVSVLALCFCFVLAENHSLVFVAFLNHCIKSLNQTFHLTRVMFSDIEPRIVCFFTLNDACSRVW